MSKEASKGLGHLWEELKRRRVIRVTVLYAVPARPGGEYER